MATQQQIEDFRQQADELAHGYDLDPGMVDLEFMKALAPSIIDGGWSQLALDRIDPGSHVYWKDMVLHIRSNSMMYGILTLVTIHAEWMLDMIDHIVLDEQGLRLYQGDMLLVSASNVIMPRTGRTRDRDRCGLYEITRLTAIRFSAEDYQKRTWPLYLRKRTDGTWGLSND